MITIDVARCISLEVVEDEIRTNPPGIIIMIIYESDPSLVEGPKNETWEM